MKLIRFMSVVELDKFRAGELLDNRKDHHALEAHKTDAVGFCFLDYDEYDEQKAYHFLSGIVSPEICAVFQVDDVVVEKYMKNGEGTFAAPMASFTDFFSSMQVTEYSTQRYSNQNMELLKYSDNFNDNWDEGFERIFPWKKPDAAITRKIQVIDMNPKPRPPKKDTPEQHLLDAIEIFIRNNMTNNIPEDFFDGFRLTASPTMNLERSFNSDRLSIEGLEFVKHEGIGL